MSEVKVEVSGGEGTGFSSPPASAVPVKREEDAAQKLHEMARELMRARNRKMMLEYLRLRSALR
ncbi:MAG TPA: hypothetical protein VGP94_11175 [Tepidisphaeraceae bacterium]|jgi:hypothetical protein|nr:hypothetical protein [Tepidisphaeraceae bacterium]